MTRLHNNPHDALFRVIFEDPHRADPLIRGFLPPEVTQLLTSEPMQPRPGTWIDSELIGHQANILYEGRLRSGGLFTVYILLEHKSWDDRNLPLQILRYQSRIWESYAKAKSEEAKNRRHEKLPYVIPLVFYHGRRRWAHPLSIAGMMDRKMPEVLTRFTPNSECILCDLGSYESDELSQDVVSWALLSALAISRSEPASLDRLHKVLAALPKDHPLLAPLLRYIVLTMDVDMDVLERIGRDARPQDWEIAMGTIAEKWQRTYLAEGRVETILRLLTRRFGILPSSARRYVSEASMQDLDAWTDALLDAKSVDEVFAATARD